MMLPTIETGPVGKLQCACCHGNAGYLYQASRLGIDNRFMEQLIFTLCPNENESSYSHACSPMRFSFSTQIQKIKHLDGQTS